MFGTERVNSCLRERSLRSGAGAPWKAVGSLPLLRVEVQVEVAGALKRRYRGDRYRSEPDHFGRRGARSLFLGITVTFPCDEGAAVAQQRRRVLDQHRKRSHRPNGGEVIRVPALGGSPVLGP